jgi:hypothetical protein
VVKSETECLKNGADARAVSRATLILSLGNDLQRPGGTWRIIRWVDLIRQIRPFAAGYYHSENAGNCKSMLKNLLKE